MHVNSAMMSHQDLRQKVVLIMHVVLGIFIYRDTGMFPYVGASPDIHCFQLLLL